MKLSQLETLIWTCRLGSVRKAAAQLGTSQSAASARLQELEEHLGITLLLRDTRPMRITPQGREVLQLAESIIELTRRIERHATAAKPIHGTIRLGSNHGVASSWLPMLLRTVYEKLPGVEIELMVELTDRLITLMHNDRLDMAFVFGPIEDPLLGYRRLYDVPLEWVASRRCVGVPELVTPRGIARFPVLTDATDSPLHRAVVGWFRAAKVKPRRIDICSGPLSRLNLALDGDWLTVVPTTVLRAYSRGADFERYECDPPLEPMEMGVAFRLVSEVGETIQHVLGTVPQVISEWERLGRRVVFS